LWDEDGKPGGNRTRHLRISDEPPPSARERARDRRGQFRRSDH